MMPIPILVDTREQLPFEFSEPHYVVVKGTLKSGDYSLVGFESQVAVERKSLQDFIGSITQGRDRFERELERLRGYAFARVVVEGSIADVLAKRYRSNASPQSVIGTAFAFDARYCPVVWAGNREMAQRMTAAWLRRQWLDLGRPTTTAKGNA